MNTITKEIGFKEQRHWMKINTDGKILRGNSLELFKFV